MCGMVGANKDGKGSLYSTPQGGMVLHLRRVGHNLVRFNSKLLAPYCRGEKLKSRWTASRLLFWIVVLPCLSSTKSNESLDTGQFAYALSIHAD
jgi:hypothetical protein